MKRLFLLLILLAAPVLAQTRITSLSQSQTTAQSAAWTSATSSDTALSLTVTNFSTAILSFNPSGSITGGTLSFEVSDDSGNNWYPTTAVRADSFTVETTFALNGATKKLWCFDVRGVTTFRVRLNPVITGAGTANLRLQAQAGAGAMAMTVGQATAANLNATVSGTVSVNALPTGGNTIGAVNLAQYTPASGRLPVDGSGVTQPVSAASLPLPSGAATAAKQPALGTAGSAASDVITVQGIASMTALKVDGSAVTQPVSGTVSVNALPTGGNTIGAVNLAQYTPASGRLPVDGSGVTQPISAASLPLPSGAATAAKQPALGTAGSASSDVLTVQGIASMTALKVDGSAVTQPVSGTITAAQSTAANLKVEPTGNVASGATDSGNPLKIGGVFSSTLPTLTDGQRGNVQLTNKGQVQSVLMDAAGNGRGVNVNALNQLSVSVDNTVAVASHNVTNLGTFAVQAAQSGTWTVQPGNTANTTAWLVTGTGGTFPATQSGTWNINNISGTISLPTGAATESTLASLNGKLNTEITADYDTGAGTQTMKFVGLALPASGGAVAGGTSTNPLRTDPTGITTQPVSGTVSVNALPTGNNTIGAVNLAQYTPASGRLPVDGSGVTQPISASSLPLPSGAATAAKQPALGTAGSASSDVITVQGIASMTALKVDGSAVTQPVSGTITANIGTAGSLALDASVTGLQVSQGSTTSGQKGSLVQGAVTTSAPSYTTAQTSPLSLTTAGGLRIDGSGVTQPISAASLPLPSGAATAAKQPALGTAGSASSDVISVQGIASMTALKVDGSAVTQPVSGTVSITTNSAVNVAQINGVAPTMGNGASGTGVQRVTIANDSTGQVALAAGSNTIGALTANQSVNLNQVAGSSIATGNGAASGSVRVTVANDSTGQIGLVPLTAGGLSISRTISAASTNATSVKGSAGQVYAIHVINTNAAVRYLKIYNKASSPTVGTDTPVLTFPIPASATGAGFVLSTEMGIAFGTGIAFAVTTGVADSDTGAVGANEIVINLLYK